MIPCQEALRGMLTLMFKKFGIFGALAIAVGILGAPYFRNFGSPKIRKNWSTPKPMSNGGPPEFSLSGTTSSAPRPGSP